MLSLVTDTTQGKDLEKEDMYQVLSLDKKLYGKMSIKLADDMERFGRYQVAKERYRQAEGLLRRALAIKERERGKEHPELTG